MIRKEFWRKRTFDQSLPGVRVMWGTSSLSYAQFPILARAALCSVHCGEGEEGAAVRTVPSHCGGICSCESGQTIVPDSAEADGLEFPRATRCSSCFFSFGKQRKCSPHPHISPWFQQTGDAGDSIKETQVAWGPGAGQVTVTWFLDK